MPARKVGMRHRWRRWWRWLRIRCDDNLYLVEQDLRRQGLSLLDVLDEPRRSDDRPRGDGDPPARAA